MCKQILESSGAEGTERCLDGTYYMIKMAVMPEDSKRLLNLLLWTQWTDGLVFRYVALGT